MFLSKSAFTCLFVFAVVFFTLPHLAKAESATFHHVQSDLDFATVKQKALTFIKDKKLTLFAEYDHAKNAQDVQLTLAPTTVLVFGSPLVGTKLMQNFPGIGMELPLKVLVSQNSEGKTVFTYPDLATVFAPYGVKKDHEVVQKMQKLLQALATFATK